MGGFSVCRDGRENSPQASERPWDVLFFYVITKMIDRRRNYNLSGQEQTLPILLPVRRAFVHERCTLGLKHPQQTVPFAEDGGCSSTCGGATPL